MMAAISWISRVIKKVPTVADPHSKEEIEEILKYVPETREDGSENDENMNVDALSQIDELSHALSAANSIGKVLMSANPEAESITEALKELDMDKYDEEDDGVELFGHSNTYYASNALDPYLKDGVQAVVWNHFAPQVLLSG